MFDALGAGLLGRLSTTRQMLLVLIGGYLLALRKWLAGGIVAAVGLCLLLIDQLDWHIPLDKIAVPTILIAVGLSVVFSRRKYE